MDDIGITKDGITKDGITVRAGVVKEPRSLLFYLDPPIVKGIVPMTMG